MLKGNRTTIAIGGALLAVAVLSIAAWRDLAPKDPRFLGDEGYQAVETDYRAGGANCEPSRLMALPAGDRQAERDRCAEAREQRRQQENEILQQRRLAEASEISAVLSARSVRTGAWLLVASLVGLGAAFWAAWAASRAAIYARTAAYETRRSADIAKDAMVANERAWIGVALIPEGPIEFHSRGLNFNVGLNVRNLGKTPAINCFTEMIAIGGGGDPAPFLKEFAASKKRIDAASGRLVLPRECYTRQWTVGLEPNETQANAGEFFAWVIGCVTYQVVPDGSLHQTAFCFMIGPDEPNFFAGVGAIRVGVSIPKDGIAIAAGPGGFAD